ncbi:MAG: type II toxin-antitoxin system PemK/MazF family toxin [Parcubacteria group bacterium]|nr:type II toxin-antitoxin system PemK/MazF family toxin [Parcubacteria group bacterium]
MQKDFDGWNKKKKKIDAKPHDNGPLPKERWVWLCSIGANIGFEQDGTGTVFERPVLVVKKFNNKMYWVVPLSTKQKPYDFYFNFTDPNGQASSAILAQMRLVSVKRFIRDMYALPEEVFMEIVARLVGFLKKSKPRTGRGFSRPEGTL